MKKLAAILSLLGALALLALPACNNNNTNLPSSPFASGNPTQTFTPLATSAFTPSGPTTSSTPTSTPTATPTFTPTGTATTTPTSSPTPYPTTAWSLYATLGQAGTLAYPPGSNGYFDSTMGVAVGTGYIAVSDNSYQNVQVFNSTGGYLYSVAPHGSTPSLWGMSIDASGELYVADLGSAEVDGYSLGPSGYTYDYTWSAQGGMAEPLCVKTDASGNLVVGDIGTNSVWNLAWTDDSVLNQTTFGAVPNMEPFDLALDNFGNIYVSDEDNNQVDIFNAQYAYTGFAFNGSGVWTTQLGVPNGIGVDSQGNLFISDPDNTRVVYTTAQGAYLGEIDGFSYPTFLALDGSDDLFVADKGATMVDEFTR